MTRFESSTKFGGRWLVALFAMTLLIPSATAIAGDDGPRAEVYGFAMLDMGYEAGQADPNWFDVMRPTKLPAYADEYGADGHWFSGVRQSRFGIKTWSPTDLGQLYTILEIDLFGTGPDAGQTTLRLRHAYGELGHFGAGQTYSPFMDIDVFPNSIEYWGPNAMVFFRNVQFRWMPIQGDTRMTVAIERPGGSGDQGDYYEDIEAQGVAPRFPAPDLSAEYHYGGSKGYIELGAIVRYMAWDDTVPDAIDLDGDAVGWGLNLSGNWKLPSIHPNDVFKWQIVYGEGIQNYMNDATEDIAAIPTNNPSAPFTGEPIPMLGVLAFFDHYWSDRWSSTLGYSLLDIDNYSAQSASTFSKGQYALANLLYYPVPNVMMGIEMLWGKRDNFTDGFSSDDFRVQFSAKYNFSAKIGG